MKSNYSKRLTKLEGSFSFKGLKCECWRDWAPQFDAAPYESQLRILELLETLDGLDFSEAVLICEECGLRREPGSTEMTEENRQEFLAICERVFDPDLLPTNEQD